MPRIKYPQINLPKRKNGTFIDNNNRQKNLLCARVFVFKNEVRNGFDECLSVGCWKEWLMVVIYYWWVDCTRRAALTFERAVQRLLRKKKTVAPDWRRSHLGDPKSGSGNAFSGIKVALRRHFVWEFLLIISFPPSLLWHLHYIDLSFFLFLVFKYGAASTWRGRRKLTLLCCPFFFFSYFMAITALEAGVLLMYSTIYIISFDLPVIFYVRARGRNFMVPGIFLNV